MGDGIVSLGTQSRRLRSFLMISRISFAYSSMILRSSSERVGLGFGASLSGPGLSGWFMSGCSAQNQKGL